MPIIQLPVWLTWLSCLHSCCTMKTSWVQELLFSEGYSCSGPLAVRLRENKPCNGSFSWGKEELQQTLLHQMCLCQCVLPWLCGVIRTNSAWAELRWLPACELAGNGDRCLLSALSGLCAVSVHVLMVHKSLLSAHRVLPFLSWELLRKKEISMPGIFIISS